MQDMSKRLKNENVLSVASRQVDALIAEKVMGLRPCSDPIGRCDAAKMTPCQCWGLPDRNGVVAGEELTSYSTDISAAWQVVEKMKSNGLWFLLEYEEPPQCCYASFYAPINESGENGSRGNTYADTAPLAICLAALQAVEK